MGRTLLEISVQGGGVILLVFLLRAAARGRVPRRVFPALWVLACICLLCPFRLGVALPAPAAEPPAAARPAIAPPDASAPAEKPAPLPAESSAAPEGGRAAELLPILWAVGAAGVGGWFLTAHLYYRWKYRAAVRVEDGPVRDFLAAHPLGRQVAVKRTAQVTSPLTYGLVRPVILLPWDLSTEGEALPFVLAHELVHIRRWDVGRKWVLALAVSIHWFNPLVWLMYALAGRDIELACDEAAVAPMDRPRRAAYLMFLLDLAERRSGAAPLGTGFGKNAVKERVMTMINAKKPTAWGKAAAAAAVILVAAAGLLTVDVAAENSQTPPVQAQTPAPAPTPALHIPAKEWILEHGYPTNDLGETYGPNVKELDDDPDLILARTPQGLQGYLRWSEFPGSSIRTPEEAMAYCSKDYSPCYVNLYLQDGVTVIGTFQLF